MDELMKEIENNIRTISLTLERNKNGAKFKYVPEAVRYLRLTELCMSLEKWEAVHRLLVKYQNTRCRPIEKKSDLFVRIIENERKGIPGLYQ